jgi:hypothetical protein
MLSVVSSSVIPLNVALESVIILNDVATSVTLNLLRSSHGHIIETDIITKVIFTVMSILIARLS